MALRSQPWSSFLVQDSRDTGSGLSTSMKISVPTEQMRTSGFPSGTSSCNPDVMWDLRQAASCKTSKQSLRLLRKVQPPISCVSHLQLGE